MIGPRPFLYLGWFMTFRILALDIETRPAMSYHFGLWNQNIGIGQMVESPGMLCFAARWMDENKTMFFSDWQHGREGMVRKAWELLNEADVLMTYNGAKFDVPHLQREFIELGLTPPAPYQQLDLYKTIKKQFAFISKKLDFVAQQLDVGEKVKHSGFHLWIDCLNGVKSAHKQMEKYNRQDVDLLIEMHDILLPWIPNYPSHAARQAEDVCPACGEGSPEVIKREGNHYTKQGTYQRFHCKPEKGGCGKWFQSTKSTSMVRVREVATS